ncbi:lysylphosphatidylglycerol synthase transmembrane domain-containing protein [Frankia sp. AgB32]|uniref:lysylphosphatidylglycerol synthase transmembrane domain-containing protein n=1 Tax=Frankia sp. AgB32 TaxID=631119 RepID=UPI0020109D6E|nr:lysylphosphatidylglycerol synthase transmembrane domain-containing protein [Frankia sp. AgB32]MCK9896548.1 flippase-like domain-containing protein [Frankia sp. AgB32]
MGQHSSPGAPAPASPAPAPDQSSGTARSRRRGPRWWLVRGALLLALGLLAVALVSQWRDVRDSYSQLTAASVVASGAATVLAVGTTVLSWRALLAGLGARLPLRAAVRIFFVGQIGKYIPGSVWPVLAQMELSRDYGVSRPKAASASLVVLALAVPSGGLAAAVTLPFVSAKALASYWWALVAVPVFAVLLFPPVLSRLLALAFRLLRRPPLDEPLTLRPIAAGSGWLLLSFAWYGLATWLLVRDLDPSVGGARLAALSVGAYALAWTAGFLVLVLPAGAGVREAVLVLALAPAIASGPATLVALVARLLATLADLVWAGIGVALRGRGALPSGAATAGPDADAAAARVTLATGDESADPERGTPAHR